MATYTIAVDVGGTFTDVVLSDLETGKLHLLKTPSTPEDPSQGILIGVSQILSMNGVRPNQIQRVFHGTTIATNAILEGKGTRVGVIVSEGFKYVLEIGRHSMARLANPHVWQKPERPVPPENVVEVPERTSFDGTVITPLNEDAVRVAARYFRERGINSIAVSLLHSYASQLNERRVAQLMLQEFPEAHISLSSDVLPVFREYERTITTVLNAYVSPQVSYYIENLGNRLIEHGVDAPLLIMKSNGGVIGVEEAIRRPVYTALSGPAAGVMAALNIGALTGMNDCISFDMGGTSTDVSLINEGTTASTLNGHLGDWPMQLPMLDIATIGAGGGSIACLTPANNLSVGPFSAGARPGPACYGQGGTKPTVTDANLVLGRIDTAIAGGSLHLDIDAAKAAIEDEIAKPLGLDVYRAANGILQIVNNTMMGAIRNVSVERGHDPRQFALVAFGGAGPMHAIDVAALLDIPVVIAPPNPGVSSAYGLLVADFKNDYARTFIQKPPNYNSMAMEGVYQELEREALEWLDSELVPASQHQLTRSADLRYAHQGSEVTAEFTDTKVNADSLNSLIENFHQRHRQLFGFALEQPVEIVTLRVIALGQIGSTGMVPLSGDLLPPEQAITGQRLVFFNTSEGFSECKIYHRGSLAPMSVIPGPAILENVDSTVIINPGWQGSIDEFGNCIMRPV